ncbi:MAG: relaxase/mobilization nuclease domain-containing protein [Cyclobacteriaceae bacterium]|nr:relaxase/mobilization nuclease domain-containing protein [Cyclobacteriaceae bacterium]
MTGNQIKGKGFRGALRYNLEKVDKGVAELLYSSFAGKSENSILKEVQLIRVQKPNLLKYFYHTSINFPPEENLSNEVMKRIGHDYLQANGFTQHQFIMFRHFDADHPHLHILVNRIGYDGKVLSDSNDYKRSEQVLRELEIKYSLTKVVSSREAKERAMTKDELEMMKRTNTPSAKMKLQTIIKDVLSKGKSLTTEQFITALEHKGVKPQFNQATTGYVSGISYEFQGFIIKGAALGHDFKWPTIKNSIDFEQERDRLVIHEANNRAKSARTESGTNPINNLRDRNSSYERSSSLEESQNPDLTSLLNDLFHVDRSNPDNYPDLVSDDLTRRKKKRKRRGRSI